MESCIDCGGGPIEANERCASCNHALRKAERQANKIQVVKPVRKVSQKRAKENQEYAKLRKEYLEAYPSCEVPECHRKSTTVHHMAGRENEKLLDVNNFLAVCFDCHERITRDSKWAIENGFSILRTI